MEAKGASFGDFTLSVDTIPPELILEVKEKQPVSMRLTARIKDDLSGFSTGTLPDSYINGVWIPTQYDPEKERIYVSLLDIEPGQYTWLVEAMDVAGNAVRDSVRFIKR